MHVYYMFFLLHMEKMTDQPPPHPHVENYATEDFKIFLKKLLVKITIINMSSIITKTVAEY